MDVDMMLFQELAFTVGLSVVIYFILCKFHSNLSQEKDNSMSTGFCCVDASEKKEIERFGANSMVDQGKVEDDEAAYVDNKDDLKGVEGIVDKVFDESSMRRKFNEIEVEGPLGDDFREIQIEGSAKMEGDEDFEEKATDEKGNEMLIEGSEDMEDELFDDWEGIERTELEKDFGAAVVFVDSKGNAEQLKNDVKMQLYGLHKVTTDGPCCRTQPLALKLSARAKWNAWQRLGDISREDAMEQYIAILSRNITDWKDEQ